MPFDAYSLCPGGRDKKIKFCCSHLQKELNEIERMMDGEQFAACLRYVEELQEKNENCACLDVAQIVLLRLQEQIDKALEIAEKLVQREPDNVLAWAELATCRAMAIESSGQAALDAWQESIAKGKPGSLLVEAFGAMLAVAQRFLAEGRLMPAMALAYYHDMSAQEPAADSLWIHLQRMPRVPSIMKTIPSFKECPDGVAWKAEYDSALRGIEELRWKEALAVLEGLTDKADEFPWLWQTVAMLRGWLLDQDGCIEALKKLAGSDIDAEDAAEARLITLFLEEDPLGDQVEVFTVTYEIKDYDLANESLLSWDHAVSVPIDPAAWNTEEDGPAPRTGFALFDGPKPVDDAELDPATLPRALANCLLFGRETDRPARLLFIELPGNTREIVEANLKEKLGDAFGGVMEEASLAHSSLVYQQLRPRWRTPQQPDPEKILTLTQKYKDTYLLETWPSTPIPVLDGKTPREAAEDKSRQAEVLAMILLLEHWTEDTLGEFDFNNLRSALNLPTLGDLDPTDRTGVMNLSPLRMSRLPFEKLEDDALSAAFARSVMLGDRASTVAAAKTLVARDSMAEVPVRFQAYHQLASNAESAEECFKYIDEAKAACHATNRSCAQFDLYEIPLRLQSGEPEKAGELIQHLQACHLQEPGVAEALMQTLVSLGILRPDGSPNMPMQSPAGPAPSQAPDGGGLWTPDGGGSAPPSDQGGQGGSGLWTPD